MMNKLLKDIFIYGIADVFAIFVSSFFIVPLLTKTLSQYDYSLYIICVNASSIFSFVFMFGLVSVVALLYKEYEYRISEFLSTVIFLQLILSVLFFIIFLFFKNFVWNLLASELQNSSFFYISLCIAYFTFPQSCLGIIFRYSSQVIRFAILQFIIIAINIIFLIFYFFSNKSVCTALMILLGTNFFSSFISCVYMGKKYIRLEAIRIGYITKILKCCITFLVSHIFSFISDKVFIIYLQKYSMTENIGVFNLLFMYSSLIIMVSNTLIKVFSPILYDINKTEEWYTKVNKIWQLVVTLYFLFILFMNLFAFHLIKIFSSENYYNRQVVFYLLIGCYFSSISSVSSQVLLSYRKFRYCNICSFINGGLTIILSYCLIKSRGIYGASITYCLVQFFSFIFQYFSVLKISKSKIQISYVFGVGVLLYFLSIYINYYICLTILTVFVLLYLFYFFMKNINVFRG